MAISFQRSHPRMRRLFELLALLLALLLLGHIAAPRALGFQARSGDQIVIGAGQTIDDDLYLAGQSIVVDGTVNGALIAAAQTITVNGTINGDLNAAAQTVVVNGTIRDSARIAAQVIDLQPSARIGRDLMAAGYSVHQQSGGAISRDAAMGAAQALLAGTVGRNVVGGMGALAIQGSVGGNVDVKIGDTSGAAPPVFGPPPTAPVPSVPPGLTIADTATVAGSVTYEATQQYPIAGQVGQGVVYTPRAVEQPPQRGPSNIIEDQVRRLIALGVIGLLMLWLAPRRSEELTAILERRPLPSLGWGIIAAAGATAVVVAIALVTLLLAILFGVLTLGSLAGLVVVVGGLGDVALAVALTVFAAFVAQALAALLTGRLIARQFRPDWLTRRYVPFLVGLPVFVIVTAIPVLGGLIGLIAAIMGLGAVWLDIWDHREPTAATLPLPEPAPVAA